MSIVTLFREQSGRSGLPVHEASAGIRDLRVTAVAGRRLGGEWRAAAVASLGRLRGDAATSPLTWPSPSPAGSVEAEDLLS